MDQKRLIQGVDWDIMIVCDSFRYDIFKEISSLVFKGFKTNLLKTNAISTWTLGWFIEAFHQGDVLEDTILIASSPARKTKDTRVYDLVKRFKYRNVVFEPENYFKEVVDVCKTAFDERLGIVPPETMIQETKKSMRENPECKIISKYYQVHDPYLYFIDQGDIEGLEVVDYSKKDEKVHGGVNIKKLLTLVFSNETIWKWLSRIGSPPSTGIGRLWSVYGREGIIRAYKSDMKTVLELVRDEIVSSAKDKLIVITTDHGENLGEKGMYGHGKNTRNVIMIPWLEVDNR